MLNKSLIQEISNKINEMVKNSPISDLDKNIHALIQGAFTKMELVSREEYDAQTKVLAETRAKLDALEQRLASLESSVK
jgi:BMFP domain-containing protein YqiC